MSDTTRNYRKPTLDKDLDKLGYMEEAVGALGRRYVAPGLALLFIALCALLAGVWLTGHAGGPTIAVAAVIGAYMALNIGANDVANNMGPAVGSRALSLGAALVIAAIFESAGALVAGGDVVETVAKGIVAPETIADSATFMAVMLSALMASALWINLATWIGAPVSTTHAIVGGVVGAGITAAGVSAVDWSTMGGIAASWVISPVMGGVIAAAALAFVKTFIIYRDDKIAAARRWVPVLIAVMAGVFAAYLAKKGLGRITHIGLGEACLAGLAVGIVFWLVSVPMIRRDARGLENRNQSLRALFNMPLVASAALLSFAHGANDVANAVGPLAAIVHTAEFGDVATAVDIPIWVMVVGALGISLGLILFGPRLIQMVGGQITKLNPMRAYCVALSAGVTVLVASALGLPVSSTHIAVGAVFGVGFFREWYTERSKRRVAHVNKHRINPAKKVRPVRDREEQRRRRLVRRAHFTTIVAAWIVTVPSAAAISSLIFLAVRLVWS
ncbi:MAG: inorganic phosphate transporter [Flavobacteriaceae bacterium]